MKRHGLSFFILLGTAVLASSSAAAAPQPLIKYFQPMPIIGKLSTTVWGAATVGARDPANGLEDNGANGGVGPQQETNFYWDGKILKGEDGKYHLYNSHWAHDTGFGAPAGGNKGWGDSICMEAISDNVMGPYIYQNDCYAKNEEGNSKGHNVTAIVAPSGANPYTIAITAIVPSQMFSAPSSNGPWTLLGYSVANANGHTGCGNLTDNFTFTIGPDGRFWATGRAGCIQTSAERLGTYEAQTDSVLPDLEHGDNGNAEDECLWYSGGYYHIVYNYWNFQRAYHIMSKDGLTNWTSTGAAYQGLQTPANSYSNWLRYTDGTVNHWHNMERVGVYQENGHVTHFTFAVTDVDKNVTGINNGGSKILVVPFNGVQFDCDNGDAASCAEVANGGTGGSGGTGSSGVGGDSDLGGAGGIVSGNGQSSGGGTGGQVSASGANAMSTGGMVGAAAGAGGNTGLGTGGATSGIAATDGAGTGGGSESPGSAGSSANGSGCACDIPFAHRRRAPAALLLLASLGVVLRRSRRRALGAGDAVR